MTNKNNSQSDAEIAAAYEALKEAGTELDNLVPVRANVSKDPRAVFSVRLTGTELDLIDKAARKRGVTISELIRTAALAAASDELDLNAGERETMLAEVRQQVRTLAETVSRI